MFTDVQGLNKAISELTVAIKDLTFEIAQQNEAYRDRDRNYKPLPPGRRVHSKIEALGLSDTILELLNKGLTYAQISDQLGNKVSKAAVGRFVKRNKAN